MFQVWFTNYKTGLRVYMRIETMVALEELNRGDGVMARSAIYVAERAEPWMVIETCEEIREAVDGVLNRIRQQQQVGMFQNRVNGSVR